MGYWVNTTYIRHDSVAAVAGALAALCAEEGMAQIAAPAQRERLTVEPLQYAGALENDLWGIALFPGAPGWTVLQSAPLELLAERAPGADRMRLAQLAARLGVPAFQLNVYDSSGCILVEASAEGEVLISGFNPESEAEDPFEWYGERLDEERFEAGFNLLPYQAVIAGAELADDVARCMAGHFGGDNAHFCDNLVSVDTLICHKPFQAPGGLALYFHWQGPSRQAFPPCRTWEEYRAVRRGEA